MKILKKILIGIGAVIALLLIIALFVKKEYAVEREVLLNKPKTTVFDYLKLVKNQDNFSVWNMRDPNMKKTYTGTDGTVGFVYGWDSENKKVGTGEQEIKKITDGERIDFELRFTKPFEATDNAYFSTEMIDSTHTKVKWGTYGKIKYPMNLMVTCMMNMDEMLGKDLQDGLNNLKAVLEK